MCCKLPYLCLLGITVARSLKKDDWLGLGNVSRWPRLGGWHWRECWLRKGKVGSVYWKRKLGAARARTLGAGIALITLFGPQHFLPGPQGSPLHLFQVLLLFSSSPVHFIQDAGLVYFYFILALPLCFCKISQGLSTTGIRFCSLILKCSFKLFYYSLLLQHMYILVSV